MYTVEKFWYTSPATLKAVVLIMRKISTDKFLKYTCEYLILDKLNSPFFQ